MATSMSTESRERLRGTILADLNDRPNYQALTNDQDFLKLLRGATDFLTGSNLITIERFESADTINLDLVDRQHLQIIVLLTRRYVSGEIHRDRLARLEVILEELRVRGAQAEFKERLRSRGIPVTDD